MNRTGRGRVGLWAVVAVALPLAGCGITGFEWINRQPAQEQARLAQPEGTLYSGWRVFQQRCAGCHGNTATGTERAPDLLPRVRELGPQRFVDLVLRRYEWDLPGGARDTRADDVLTRAKGAVSMPAWQGEPVVSAHIMDLYAYLTARADGRQGPGRPAP